MNLAFVIFVSFLVANVSGDNSLTSDAYDDDKIARIVSHEGKNFTIFCVMVLEDFLGYNSSNMEMLFNPNIPLEKVLPSFTIETLNETTLALHIYNPPQIKEVLNCVVRQNNSVTYSVDMVSLEIGRVPEKVEDFRCRTYNWDKMVCNFTAPFNCLFPEYSLFFGIDKFSMLNDLEDLHISENNRGYSYTLSYETATYRPGFELYYFRLNAKNRLGELDQNFVINNYELCIPDPPVQLAITRLRKYGAKISWQVPSIMAAFRKNITHKIMYSFNNSSFIEYTEINTFKTLNSAVLLRLPHANTWYEVRVYIKVTAAPNTDEFWSHSNTIFCTLPDRPSKPPTVIAGSFYRKFDSNDLIVYWKEVENIYKNGQGYNVSIVDRDGNNVKIIHMTNTMATIPYVDDMTYKLYSENVIGKLETYSEIFVPSNQLPKITDLKKTLSGNAFKLSWSYTVPNNFNENIENFTVFWCMGKATASDECATSIDFKVLDNSTLYFTYPILDVLPYNFAVSVNTKSTSSGMAWAQCTADPNTSVGKLTAFYISSVSSNSMVVKWDLDCIYKTVVTGFNIKYCKLRDPKNASCDGDAMIHSIPGYAREHRIRNLVPYTSYSISIQMYTNKRIGKFSDPKVNTSLESKPSVPRNLRYSNLTYNSTYLEWDPPLNKNGRLDHYVIWYKAKNDPVEQKEIRIEESSSLSHVLSNLDSYTTYEIWVTACTRYCSNSSNLVTIETKIGPPMKVLNLMSTSDSQILSWSQAKPTGPHEIYDVIVRGTVRDKAFEYIASTVKGTQCTIKKESNCNPEDSENYYDFYVKPKNIIFKDGNEYLEYKPTTITKNFTTNITNDSTIIHKKQIEKRHTLIDTNSENRFNALNDPKDFPLWNNNDDIMNDENRLYCLEAVDDISNLHVVYDGEAIGIQNRIVCNDSAFNFKHTIWIIISFGLIVSLIAAGLAIYKKIQIMNDFKIDLPDGLKELKMEKPITNFIDLNNYANKSPYILAKEKEERLHVHIDEQEQCLLKQRLESISSTSNNSGDNHYVCNEAIDNAHSIDDPPMDNKFETVTENDDSDKSTVSTYKIPMQVFPPVTLPTTTRIKTSISHEHLLESHDNTHSNIDLEEEKQKYLIDEDEKIETPISQLRNVHNPIFKPLYDEYPLRELKIAPANQQPSVGYSPLFNSALYSLNTTPVFNGYAAHVPIDVNQGVSFKPVVADKPDFAVQPSVISDVDAPMCTQRSIPYTALDAICLRKPVEPKLEDKNMMIIIGQPQGQSGLRGYVTRDQLRSVELAIQDANINSNSC